MKYIFLTPWKIAPSSEVYSFVQDMMKRLGRSVTCQWVFPPSPLASDDKVANFLVKECKKWKQEGCSLICLDERGKHLDSDEFARSLEKCDMNSVPGIVFCFGGAYGLPAELREFQPLELISLTRLTLQHELAFAVLIEQLYRARCILANHPYHHGAKSPLIKAIGK
jgi:23S rRNA (pseudouridine1915-N3)-methyltransferase